MISILQVNSVCGQGSTGRIATDLHSILRFQGYESTVAYGRDPAINCFDAIRIGRKIDNYLHVAKTRLFDAHGFGSFLATKKFINKIEHLRPDVIHLHNLHGYYMQIALLFEHLKKIRKPIIWTLHDCWAFTGHCSYYDYIGCEKWKKVCHHCPLKAEYPSSFFFDRSARNYQQKKEIFTGLYNLTLVTPSIWLKNQIKDSFLSEYPVKVINNGIDLDVFMHASSDIRVRYNLEGKFLILGVASIWSERKGLKYFIEIEKRLRRDEKIILVGVNKKQINQLPDGIIGIQRTDSVAELSEIYGAVDVFVNPTLEDNYPTTNLEALACGTPVITFNTGGSPESIKDGCGLVVDRGHLESLINAISVIKKNQKAFYTENCRQHAISSFDKNKRFEEYIELYKSCVER